MGRATGTELCVTWAGSVALPGSEGTGMLSRSHCGPQVPALRPFPSEGDLGKTEQNNNNKILFPSPSAGVFKQTFLKAKKSQACPVVGAAGHLSGTLCGLGPPPAPAAGAWHSEGQQSL